MQGESRRGRSGASQTKGRESTDGGIPIFFYIWRCLSLSRRPRGGTTKQTNKTCSVNLDLRLSKKAAECRLQEARTDEESGWLRMAGEGRFRIGWEAAGNCPWPFQSTRCPRFNFFSRNTSGKNVPLSENIALSLRQLGPKSHRCRKGKKVPGGEEEGILMRECLRCIQYVVLQKQFPDPQGRDR